MTGVLLDTHAWGWSFYRQRALSAPAVDAMRNATQILVSPVSFFEMAQKARLGKWPEIEGKVGQLGDILTEQGGNVAAMTQQIATTAGSLDWEHRDPFDRIIAATAKTLGVPVVTRDRALHDFEHIDCIW